MDTRKEKAMEYEDNAKWLSLFEIVTHWKTLIKVPALSLIWTM